MKFTRLARDGANTVTINIEGKSVEVDASDTVAAAVLLHEIGYNRTTPISQSPRAPLCMMGVCYECLMEINGQANQQACQIQVQPGMTIRRQQGASRQSHEQ